MIRLIASDIDGTLLHDGETEIRQEYFDMIHRLVQAGIVFCVASGRQYSSVSRVFEPVKDEIAYICQNGAQVILNGRSMTAETFTLEESRQLVLDTRRIQGGHSIYCDDRYCYCEDDVAYEDFSKLYHFDCVRVEDLTRVDFPCMKYTLYMRENLEEAAEKEFAPKWRASQEAAYAGPEFLDVQKKGVNKGLGMKKLLEALHFDKDEAMAFGDNINDLGMFAEVGYPVAVANAKPEVLKAARIVSLSNNENGVLKVLEKVLEIVLEKI